jgi:hypothetical protein
MFTSAHEEATSSHQWPAVNAQVLVPPNRIQGIGKQKSEPAIDLWRAAFGFVSHQHQRGALR